MEKGVRPGRSTDRLTDAAQLAPCATAPDDDGIGMDQWQAGADLSIGMLTLAADGFWKQAGWPRRIAVVLFGRHQVYQHLGYRLRISFWRDNPYLVTIREART